MQTWACCLLFCYLFRLGEMSHIVKLPSSPRAHTMQISTEIPFLMVLAGAAPLPVGTAPSF